MTSRWHAASNAQSGGTGQKPCANLGQQGAERRCHQQVLFSSGGVRPLYNWQNWIVAVVGHRRNEYQRPQLSEAVRCSPGYSAIGPSGAFSSSVRWPSMTISEDDGDVQVKVASERHHGSPTNPRSLPLRDASRSGHASEDTATTGHARVMRERTAWGLAHSIPHACTRTHSF